MNWYSFIIGIVNKLIAGLGKVLAFILYLLPNSPFQSALNNVNISDYMGYINYFVPVSAMIVILEGWLAAIATVYIYQAAMRWLKITQ